MVQIKTSLRARQNDGIRTTPFLRALLDDVCEGCPFAGDEVELSQLEALIFRRDEFGSAVQLFDDREYRLLTLFGRSVRLEQSRSISMIKSSAAPSIPSALK